MKLTSLFVLLASLILISCKDDNTLNSNRTNHNPLISLLANTSISPVVEDFLNEYDQSGLIGYVAVENKKYDLINNGTVSTDEKQTAYAFISNDNRTDGLYVGGNIFVNGFALEQFHLGSYLLRSEEVFEVNFGSNDNTFWIDSSDVFQFTEGSSSFANPLYITNITPGQNISKSSNLTINWNGGKAGELVQLKITKREPIINGGKQGTYTSTKNQSLVIPSQKLSSHLSVNGEYLLEITSYDPTIIHIGNGKKLYFVAVYKHEISINIVD